MTVLASCRVLRVFRASILFLAEETIVSTCCLALSKRVT